MAKKQEDNRDIFDKIGDNLVPFVVGGSAGAGFGAGMMSRAMARKAMKVHKRNGNAKGYNYAKKIADGELEPPMSMRAAVGAGTGTASAYAADAISPPSRRRK